MTASTMVDYDTVAGGDKFGNFFVDRLPSLVSREVDEDTTGNRIYHEKGYLQGAANKVTKHIMDLLSYTFLIFPFLF
jgi:splicing factor 3B subunit 3